MKKPDPDAPDHLELGDWVTPEVAAEIIGVTPNHVRHLARTGAIVSRRFGWAWMISRQSAQAYASTERHPGPKSRDSSPD